MRERERAIARERGERKLLHEKEVREIEQTSAWKWWEKERERELLRERETERELLRERETERELLQESKRDRERKKDKAIARERESYCKRAREIEKERETKLLRERESEKPIAWERVLREKASYLLWERETQADMPLKSANPSSPSHLAPLQGSFDLCQALLT